MRARASRDAEQIEFRKDFVRRLMLRGIKKDWEIKNHFEGMTPPMPVSIRTINRYIADIKHESIEKIRSKEGLKKTVDEIALEIKENFEEISKELWTVYHTKNSLRCSKKCVKCNTECDNTLTIASSPTAKVSALKEIGEITVKYKDILQSLGLLYKVPVQQQIVDADGKPVDVDLVLLDQKFVSFFKAQFQDPLGSEAQSKKVPNESNQTA